MLDYKYIYRKNRIGKPGVIKLDIMGSPFYLCNEEVDRIFDEISPLLKVAAECIDRMPEDEDKQVVVAGLKNSIKKMISKAKKRVKELLKEYKITDEEDVLNSLDAITQLEEAMSEVFK